jgi:hypothetical protein
MPIRAAPAQNRDDVAAALRQIRGRRDAGIEPKRRGAGFTGHQTRGPEDETCRQNYSDLSHRIISTLALLYAQAYRALLNLDLPYTLNLTPSRLNFC